MTLSPYALAAGAMILATPAPTSPSPPVLRTLSRHEVSPRTSTDMAAAISSQVPAEVTFHLDGALRVEGDLVRLAGWIENSATEQRVITLFPVGADGFYLEPVAGSAQRHPSPALPPPVPPAPLLMTLPARSRLRVETTLSLSDWDWVPGTPRELAWTFLFWNEPKPRGRLPLP